MSARLSAFVFSLFAFMAPLHAEEPVIGAPVPWGIDLQAAFSPLKHHIHDFHTLLLWITIAIAVFVTLLLLFVIVRFNARANPKPQTFSHNTPLEIIWTAVPVIILFIIAVPSLKLLYFLDKAAKPEMTIKVTGHQWYWSYEYPDQKIESFDSRPIWDGTVQKLADIEKSLADAQQGWIYKTQPLRLLEVDNRIVIPVETQVRINVTAADVLHSWAIPALGVKRDGVPGKLSEMWVQADKEGVYYGQCSELCGTGHAFMPIVIEAVSKEKFAEWVKTKAAPEAPPPAAAEEKPKKS